MFHQLHHVESGRKRKLRSTGIRISDLGSASVRSKHAQVQEQLDVDRSASESGARSVHRSVWKQTGCSGNNSNRAIERSQRHRARLQAEEL
eukprot:scaffold3197_cov105-Isochrysis_galbana.AAC.5